MKNKGFLLIKIICAALAMLALFQLGRIFIQRTITQKSFEELRRQTPDAATADSVPDATSPPSVLPSYRALSAQNADMAGWLKIDGTDIDYPVMYTPRDPDYYLDHGFDGSNDAHGVPYLQAECDAQTDDHLTVFGHSMQDGTMFAGLLSYAEPDFCEAHRLIRFDTLYSHGEWEVVCVFKIPEKDTGTFPYHLMRNWTADSNADDYLARCAAYALWTSGEAVDRDARLLTLSTCEYTLVNGRLAVVARQIGQH